MCSTPSFDAESGPGSSEFTSAAGSNPSSTSNASLDEMERHGQAIAQARPDLLRQVSDAQRRVLELLLVGMTEPQIAERIGRSKHTIHDHTKALYALLGVNSRVQLVLLFSRPPGEKAATKQ
ncbi:MAG: helix-turn-helix transcriptional regulator [Phycisphaerales bacterium]|jgi:DNA-binding NarL/FixJ family response regulator